jgi:hypothetical protein
MTSTRFAAVSMAASQRTRSRATTSSEGIHGRAALATDILLFETFPRQYLEFTRRQHRWIRGDWQLLPWLRRFVPVEGRRLRNRLVPMDRSEDRRQSRRSASARAHHDAGRGWLILPGHPVVWTLLGILAPAGHIFTDLRDRLRARTAADCALEHVSTAVRSSGDGCC